MNILQFFLPATILVSGITLFGLESEVFFRYYFRLKVNTKKEERVSLDYLNEVKKTLQDEIDQLNEGLNAMQAKMDEYNQEPVPIVRNIIPIHIIEQTGGAFVNLVKLSQIVYNMNFRMILPGIDNDTNDMTIFRGYTGSSIKPFGHYFSTKNLNKPKCFSEDFEFQSVQKFQKENPTLDAILIVVHEDDYKPWFAPDYDGLMVNGVCRDKFRECLVDKEMCNFQFTWNLDIDLSSWEINEKAKIVCMTHRLDRYKVTLGEVLESPRLGVNAENIALLNWMGIGCEEQSPRVCTPFNADEYSIRSNCLEVSDDMISLADEALDNVGIKYIIEGEEEDAEEETVPVRAVSFRSEFLAYFEGTSRSCIEAYFDELREITSSWSGEWLRFVDYKDGASKTYNETMVGFEWLPGMIESFWDSLDVNYTDFSCGDLDKVGCSLRDAVILAEADELHLWGSGGGFIGNVEILRSHRGKNESFFFEYDPSHCSDEDELDE